LSHVIFNFVLFTELCIRPRAYALGPLNFALGSQIKVVCQTVFVCFFVAQYRCLAMQSSIKSCCSVNHLCTELRNLFC